MGLGDLNQLGVSKELAFLAEDKENVVWAYDPESLAILSANQGALDRYGYSAEEFLRLSVLDLHPSEDAPLWIRQVFQSGPQLQWIGPLRHRTKAGEIFFVETNVLPLKLKKRNVRLAITRDVTETQRAAISLVQSEARMRSLIHQSEELYTVLEWDGTIRYQSPAAQKVLGFRTEDMQGRSVFEFLNSEDAHHLKDLLTVLQVAREPAGPFHYRYRHNDGRWVPCECVLSPFFEPGGETGILAVARPGVEKPAGDPDHVRERNQAARSIESVGQIASGVAHNFNNILTVVSLHAGLLLSEEGVASTVQSSLTEIMKAVDRASGMTRQLLTYAAKHMMIARELDLNALIREQAPHLSRILGDNIELDLDLQDDLPQISGDRGLLELLIVNLATNGRDFMRQGGKLTLRTALRHIGAREISQNPEAEAGSFACMTVADTGCGIPAEVLPSIFQPFFTTKEVGEGTGLGLAAVYGIARQHRGWIEVSSEVGRGTEFRIFLPCLTKGMKVPNETPSESATPAENSTILIVEDERAVRTVLRRILQNHGYSVMEAASPGEAIEVWKKASFQISLLLTDVIMPGGMTGWELASQLRAEKPSLRVLFTSGYTREIAAPNAGQLEHSVFLEKPYDPASLIRAVTSCLASTKKMH